MRRRARTGAPTSATATVSLHAPNDTLRDYAERPDAPSLADKGVSAILMFSSTPVSVLSESMFSAMNSFLLVAVPLFVGVVSMAITSIYFALAGAVVGVLLAALLVLCRTGTANVVESRSGRRDADRTPTTSTTTKAPPTPALES